MERAGGREWWVSNDIVVRTENWNLRGRSFQSQDADAVRYLEQLENLEE